MRGIAILAAMMLVASCSGDTTGDGTPAGDDAGTGGDVGQTTGGETTAGETTAGETTAETTGETTGETGGETTGETGGETTGETGGETTGSQFECPPNTGQRPPALSEHAGIFDPIKERVVFFGGNPEFPVECQGKNSYVPDTWAYWPRCEVWEKLAGGPSERGRSAAVYDPDHHAMIIFGGRFRAKGADPFTTPYTLYDETWWLDLTTDTWTQITTDSAPSARVSASAIWDPVGKRLVMFGGNTSKSGASYKPLNDTWAFDPKEEIWTQLQTSAGPSARLFGAGVYDPLGHAMIVIHGGDVNAFLGPFLGDTWRLDLQSLAWTKLHTSGPQAGPDRRIWPRAVYASSKDRVILFGGHDDGALGNRNDHWEFDPSTQSWDLIALNDKFNKAGNGFCDFPADFATIVEGTPERRASHVMVYWEKEDKVLIHGGKTDCGLIDDVWELDVAADTWTDLEPATIGEACLRYSESCSDHCVP